MLSNSLDLILFSIVKEIDENKESIVFDLKF